MLQTLHGGFFLVRHIRRPYHRDNHRRGEKPGQTGRNPDIVRHHDGQYQHALGRSPFRSGYHRAQAFEG